MINKTVYYFVVLWLYGSTNTKTIVFVFQI